MSQSNPPRYPGVYIETPRFESRSVMGVPVGIAGFIGYAAPRSGEAQWPVVVGSFQEFEELLEVPRWGYLSTSVRGFFENGGSHCYIAGVEEGLPISPDVLLGDSKPGARTGLWSFDEAGDVELLSVPDLMATPPGTPLDHELVVATQQQLLTFCAGGESMSRGGYFAVLDVPPGLRGDDVAKHRERVAPDDFEVASWGAFYHPWVLADDGRGTRRVPPSGHIAGGFSRTSDPGPTQAMGTVTIAAGPHQGPANQPVSGVEATDQPMGRLEAGRLLHQGINCLIPWPARGIVVWGARTAALKQPNDQISVRRVLSYIERSAIKGTQWAMFEPNEPKLWKLLRSSVNIFLEDLWKKGLLVGGSQGEAFVVQCDEGTNPPEMRDEGQVNIDIWVRPVRPIEMIVLRIVHRMSEEG